VQCILIVRLDCPEWDYVNYTIIWAYQHLNTVDVVVRDRMLMYFMKHFWLITKFHPREWFWIRDIFGPCLASHISHCFVTCWIEHQESPVCSKLGDCLERVISLIAVLLLICFCWQRLIIVEGEVRLSDLWRDWWDEKTTHGYRPITGQHSYWLLFLVCAYHYTILRHSLLKCLLALAAKKYIKIRQFGVKTRIREGKRSVYLQVKLLYKRLLQ